MSNQGSVDTKEAPWLPIPSTFLFGRNVEVAHVPSPDGCYRVSRQIAYPDLHHHVIAQGTELLYRQWKADAPGAVRGRYQTAPLTKARYVEYLLYRAMGGAGLLSMVLDLGNVPLLLLEGWIEDGPDPGRPHRGCLVIAQARAGRLHSVARDGSLCDDLLRTAVQAIKSSGCLGEVEDRL